MPMDASPGDGWTKQKQQKAFGQPGQCELADFLKVKVSVKTVFVCTPQFWAHLG